jgi:PTS system mannose-specific IIB component
MIVQIRVDDRLIHGQVALLWAKALNTKGIVVANDNAAKNEAVKATLKMACPQSQKLLVETIEDAVRIIKDPRGRDMRIFGLTNCVADALAVVKACPGMVGAVNLANVGRFDGSDPSTKTTVITSVSLNPSELDAARELCDCGIPVYHQIAPDDPQASIATALTKIK